MPGTSSASRKGATRPRTQADTLVRAPRGVPQQAAIEGSILQPVSNGLSRRELHRRLDAVIRAWVFATCRWKKESTVGEFRYVAFTFAPSPDVQVFVQFWSEPFEPVRWQVSSGRTHPPTERWLGADRWERIRTFGFEIGGDAENFEASVSIRSARDLARVAHITVEILYSALDYRGQQPLKVDLGAGVHVPTQKVFDSFTTTQVAEVMSEHGQRLLGIQDDEEAPILRFRRRGIDTTIELGARCEGTRTFRTMGLTCELEPSADDIARLTAASLTVAPIDAPRCVRLGTTLQFGGGVAISWFHERVEEWNEMIGAYRREQTRKRQAVPGQVLSEWVH